MGPNPQPQFRPQPQQSPQPIPILTATEPQIVVDGAYVAPPATPAQLPQPTSFADSPGDHQAGQVSFAGQNRFRLAGIAGAVALLLLVGGGVLLHAINNSPTASPTDTPGSSLVTTTKTPCELFSLTDAKAIIGSSAVVSVSNTQTCFYSAGISASIKLTVSKHSDASTAADAFDQLKAAAYPAVPVAKLGDNAFSADNVVTAIQGDVVVTVSATDQSGHASLPKATQVAQAVVKNF